MNYVYNIEVNFKKSLINFYEWESHDKITRIIKAPLFLVSSNDYENILNMNIKVDSSFLNDISNNICVFTNALDSICVHFNNNGIIDKISKLDLVEENEILDEIYDNKRVILKYKLLNKNNNYKYKTRHEEKIINEICKYIKSRKNKKDVIDYLYYEWFSNKKSNDKYNELLKDVNNNYSNKHDKLYKIIELIH